MFNHLQEIQLENSIDKCVKILLSLEKDITVIEYKIKHRFSYVLVENIHII